MKPKKRAIKKWKPLYELYSKGYKLSQIATIYGMPKQQLYLNFVRCGFKLRPVKEQILNEKDLKIS